MTKRIKKGTLCGANMVDVDSLDRAILAYLRDSARAPFVDIAKNVNVIVYRSTISYVLNKK